MNNGDLLDDFAIEKSAKEQFGVSLEVDKVIARNIDVGNSMRATLFLTNKKQFYCYINGPARLVYGDVRKLAVRIGLKVEMFFPPKGRPQYFDEIGKDKFREVFPGRHEVRTEDIVYYRTLAPYSPALLLISEVRDGTIYRADSDARSGWRPAVKFAYRRIKAS
ncbi:MAG: hypothetical protein ABIP74_04285 [Candidatus Saccharimonas sp.]